MSIGARTIWRPGWWTLCEPGNRSSSLQRRAVAAAGRRLRRRDRRDPADPVAAAPSGARARLGGRARCLPRDRVRRRCLRRVGDRRGPPGGRPYLAVVRGDLGGAGPRPPLLTRWRDRALVVGGIGRTRDAEARVSIRDRELEAVADISNALARARTPVDAARPLVRQVTALLGVGFAGVVVVGEGGDDATGIYAELNGVVAPWWDEVQVDLRNEPSGIASAVFDAAPVTVYDIGSSSRISPRLAAMVGAQSGAWVPMLAEERVIGVLIFGVDRHEADVRGRRARGPAGNRVGGGARTRAAPFRGGALRRARAGAVDRPGRATGPGSARPRSRGRRRAGRTGSGARSQHRLDHDRGRGARRL